MKSITASSVKGKCSLGRGRKVPPSANGFISSSYSDTKDSHILPYTLNAR